MKDKKTILNTITILNEKNKEITNIPLALVDELTINYSKDDRTCIEEFYLELNRERMKKGTFNALSNRISNYKVCLKFNDCIKVFKIVNKGDENDVMEDRTSDINYANKYISISSKGNFRINNANKIVPLNFSASQLIGDTV